MSISWWSNESHCRQCPMSVSRDNIHYSPADRWVSELAFAVPCFVKRGRFEVSRPEISRDFGCVPPSYVCWTSALHLCTEIYDAAFHFVTLQNVREWSPNVRHFGSVTFGAAVRHLSLWIPGFSSAVHQIIPNNAKPWGAIVHTAFHSSDATAPSINVVQVSRCCRWVGRLNG